MPLLGVLQIGTDAPTGLMLALAVLALAVLLLALRGLIDWLFGPEAAKASYRLVEAGEGLVIADEDEAQGLRLVGFDEEEMTELLDRAEGRNEMRLHVVIDRAGARLDWETWRGDGQRVAPQAVVIEDSKGMVEIHASGRIKAKPPLDEAVRGDLIEVIGEVLA